jgi:hypothetical protein
MTGRPGNPRYRTGIGSLAHSGSRMPITLAQDLAARHTRLTFVDIKTNDICFMGRRLFDLVAQRIGQRPFLFPRRGPLLEHEGKDRMIDKHHA